MYNDDGSKLAAFFKSQIDYAWRDRITVCLVFCQIPSLLGSEDSRECGRTWRQHNVYEPIIRTVIYVFVSPISKRKLSMFFCWLSSKWLIPYCWKDQSRRQWVLVTQICVQLCIFMCVTPPAKATIVWVPRQRHHLCLVWAEHESDRWLTSWGSWSSERQWRRWCTPTSSSSSPFLSPLIDVYSGYHCDRFSPREVFQPVRSVPRLWYVILQKKKIPLKTKI